MREVLGLEVEIAGVFGRELDAVAPGEVGRRIVGGGAVPGELQRESVVSRIDAAAKGLYNMGIPDCRPMNRQKMLEMLKIMNAGGANT